MKDTCLDGLLQVATRQRRCRKTGSRRFYATLLPGAQTRFYASISLRATYFAWALPREGNLLVDNEWTDRNTVDINRLVGQTIIGLHWVGPRFGAHLSLWLSTDTVDKDNLPSSEDPRNSFGSFMAEYRF